MTVGDWLQMATADARRRDLEALVPLLEGVGRTMAALRSATWEQAAGDARHGASGAGHPRRPATHAAEGSLTSIAARIARGELRSERLVEDCLTRIAERNPQLNAFVTVTADEALAAARTADTEAARGQVRGPLHGIPIALKDIVDQAGVLTTASSNVLRDNRAVADAAVTARLRQAGAVFVGKTNLHEFALGTTNEESAFGPALNPVDPSRSPGGSSGGSAIAVATGMALGSVGTDTGGSIRIPAAACGLVGLKPQWGEVSAEGVVPLSRQLDHVGPLARSVDDAWLLFEVMRDAQPPSAAGDAGSGRLRIGVPRAYFFDRLDVEVEAAVLGALERLGRAGASLVDVSVANISRTPDIYLLLAIADAAEYHARTIEAQAGAYTEPVRLRLEMGRYMMAEDYVRALEGKTILTRSVDAALSQVDVLALPALSIPAPRLGANTVEVNGGVEPVRAAMLRCTQPFNLTGHPAISLPCGTTAAGLPIGLQLVGHRHRTAALLAAARDVERTLADA